MRKRAINPLIALAVFTCFFGCSSLQTMSTKELYKEAEHFYKDESYYRAIPRFEEVINRDPLNKYAILSELHLADILYEKESYAEALVHYEEYLRLNPKTEKYEYVFCRIAMCHSNMISTYDRDQTETEAALKKFDEYLDRFPEGRYRAEVIKNADHAFEIKMKSEYNVGLFYYKMKEYDSAVTRCENIIRKYEKGEIIQETYLILAKSLDKLFNKDKLIAVYNEYIKKFKNAKFKDEMEALIEDKT